MCSSDLYIIQLSGSVHGIVVRADAPWQTLEAFVAEAKTRPGKLTYGTFGQASVQNLVMVDLQHRALEIVTGGYVRRTLTDRESELCAMAMQTAFAEGDLVGGLKRGIAMLAEHARPPRTLHAGS